MKKQVSKSVRKSAIRFGVEPFDETFATDDENKLFNYAKTYALRALEIAFNTRRKWLESRGFDAEEKLFVVLDGSNEEAAPAQESARQAFDFIINADGSFSMEKTRDASGASGFIVERRAVPVEAAPVDNDNASNDTAAAFKSSVKTIIISSALGRFSDVITRLQSSKTSAEITAAVLDACREVQSVDGWERYKEASIIDDEAERFATELEASCDDAERFPRLQAIAEKIAAAFGSFAVKALAAA